MESIREWLYYRVVSLSVYAWNEVDDLQEETLTGITHGGQSYNAFIYYLWPIALLALCLTGVSLVLLLIAIALALVEGTGYILGKVRRGKE